MKNNIFKIYWIGFEEYKKIIFQNKINVNFYQTTEWFKIISQNQKLETKFLVIQNELKILSITPFVKKKFLFLNFFGCPLAGTFSLYSGIILNGIYSENELFKIIEAQTNYLKRFTNYTEYIFDTNFQNNHEINNVFKKLKFKMYLKSSFLLDLTIGKDLLWKRMEGRTRNSIRKAINNNIKIILNEPDENWINDFYFMLKKTFKKSNRSPPHSKNFYLNLTKLPRDKIIFASTHKDQIILSKAIFLIDKNKIIFFSGTSNQLGYKLSANSYLLWEIISNNKNKNIQYFDFGGSGNKAIDKFKKSFGGENVNYYRWEKSNFIIKKIMLLVKYLVSKGILKINVV